MSLLSKYALHQAILKTSTQLTLSISFRKNVPQCLWSIYNQPISSNWHGRNSGTWCPNKDSQNTQVGEVANDQKFGSSLTKMGRFQWGPKYWLPYGTSPNIYWPSILQRHISKWHFGSIGKVASIKGMHQGTRSSGADNCRQGGQHWSSGNKIRSWECIGYPEDAPLVISIKNWVEDNLVGKHGWPVE